MVKTHKNFDISTLIDLSFACPKNKSQNYGRCLKTKKLTYPLEPSLLLLHVASYIKVYRLYKVLPCNKPQFSNQTISAHSS